MNMYRIFRQARNFRDARRKKKRSSKEIDKEVGVVAGPMEDGSTPKVPIVSISDCSPSNLPSPTKATENCLDAVVDLKPSKTIDELLVLPEPVLLRRTQSHDSYSTITTAGETLYESSATELSIIWADGVLPPDVISSVSQHSPKSRSNPRQHSLGPSGVAGLGGANQSVEDKPAPGMGVVDRLEALDSEVLLAKRIFSTLGAPHPQQYVHQQLSQKFESHDAENRRSLLRRSSSGGLDPYLTAPARFTRFEI